MNINFNPVDDFLSESKKQIEEIRNQLEDFTEKISQNKRVMFEDNSEFFRAIHSISGGSSFSGMKEIETVSWSLEKVITDLFSGKLEPSAKIAELINFAVDMLEYAIANKGKIRKKDSVAFEKMLSNIKSVVDEKSEKKKITPDNEKKPEKKRKVEEGEHFRVTVSEKNDNKEEDGENKEINQFVSFRIGAENYAVPITLVYDMKEMLPYSRIPKQPEHYLGVANLRGNIVPIIDFRSFLGVGNPVFDEYTVFLMLKINDKVKGCVVDGINDVVLLEPENTHTAPAMSRKTKIEYIDFIAKDPKSGQFLIVLDVERMLKDD
jgi:purine-binding chemotaxis protein CheW